MKLREQVWKQVKNLSSAELVKALERDGWSLDVTRGSQRVYRHPDGRRVSIHYHSGHRTYGHKLLRGLLEDIGWSEEDMRRLRLIR